MRAAVVVAALAVAWWWIRRGWSGERRARRLALKARSQFSRQRGSLAEQFRKAAQASGKPRGLAWKSVDLRPEEPLIAVDQATGELVALIGATIAFEAVPGGGMEEVEAVSNLREGTAVFCWREGAWGTDGRAVFNLSPDETIQRYRDDLTPL